MATPPTQSAVSAVAQGSTTRTTASMSWTIGDWVVVLGMTSDNGTTLGTPTTTGTGLSFAAIGSTPTNAASSCKGYAWSCQASASSSGTISCTRGGSVFNAVITAFVYSGSDGIGNVSVSAALGATTTQSLTRSGANSAVVQIWGDFNAVNDVTVTWTPSGETQHHAQRVVGNYTDFSASWGDQSSAGTTSYGFSGFAGGDMTAITVEILGSSGPAFLARPNAPILQAVNRASTF